MKKRFMAAVLSTLLLIGSMAGCGKADLNDSTDQSSVAGEMSDHQEETDAPEEQSEEDNSSLGGMEGTVQQPDVVQAVDGTIVECNTAYGGSRAETAMHYQVAEDHGFTDIADVQILDEDGSLGLPVSGGTHLTENLVGAHFGDYDSYLVLSHFKGHAMAGFGGAIKNISIGLGSSEGKCLIHTAGESSSSPWGGDQDSFLESMGEAGKSVVDALDKQIVYINVMNRLSVDCDCNGHPAEPDMHDIGILASTDPVALDQACIDLIYAQRDGDGASLVNRIESLNGLHTLEYAEQIGLGSRTYQLISVDE